MPAVLIGLGYMALHLLLMFVIQIVASVIFAVRAKNELGAVGQGSIQERAYELLYQNIDTITLLTQFLTIFVVILIYVIIRAVSKSEPKPSVSSYFSLKKIKPSVAGMSALLAFFLYFWVIGFMSIVGAVFPELLESYNESMSSTTEINWVSQILMVSVGAPLVEELIYRNMALTNMRKSMHPMLAVAITSVIFGVVHGNFLQIIYAAALGFVFGFLFVRTDSIFPSLIGHAVFNTIGLGFSYLGEIIQEGSGAETALNVGTVLLLLLSLAGGPLVFWWLFVKTRSTQTPAMSGYPYGTQPGYYYPPQPWYAPQNGYYPPQNGYNTPQGGYYPPQNGYNMPQGGYYPPQNGYNMSQGGYYPPMYGYQSPSYGYPPQNASQPIDNPNPLDENGTPSDAGWVFDPRFGWVYRKPMTDNDGTPVQPIETSPSSQDSVVPADVSSQEPTDGKDTTDPDDTDQT
ncbi:MAG: CPBP family intramembrane metalloprotease [Clostridia bacterium]|nr:CPBP family intramembrane metalloprotease [Clostridia bacterium]